MIVDEYERACKTGKLKVNVDKSKIMFFGGEQDSRLLIFQTHGGIGYISRQCVRSGREKREWRND